MTSTRGGLGRILAMAIGLAVCLLLAAAGVARGALYRVAQCGWGVGAELDPGYPATEGTAFSLNTVVCAPPPGLIEPGMKFEAGVAPDGTFGLARARWLAPAGTSFRAAQLTWTGELQWANWVAFGFDVGDQFRMLALNTQSTLPTPVELPIEPAWAFEARLQCMATGSFIPCTRSVHSTANLRDLTFTLEDHQAPEVRLRAPAAGGWQRGTVGLDLLATDLGAGVAGAAAWIDGSGVLDARPDCATAVIGGERRATKLQPCPTTATLTAPIDTSRLADGSHSLRACATDFSGAQACTGDETIAIDNSPPTISFADAAEGEVAATVSDRFAGAASGTISIRRAAGDAWTDLPSTLDGEGDGVATLSARLPDLAPGVYFLRAVAADRAGNSASAQLRLAGSAAELRRQAADGQGARATGLTPARRRRPTRLTARLVAVGRADARSLLVARPAGAPTAGASLTVDHGTRVDVRGRLTDQRGGVSGRSVAIVVRAAAGFGEPERHRVRTDPRGRFALRLPAGTSRHVTVAFLGGHGLAPARRRSLTLRVRADVTLTAFPTELRTGDSVHLRGRVRLATASVSDHGKLVAIQYLERATGRWRPALVVRTDATGRFDTTYRFRYVTGIARIRLRATAPAEGGWPFARGSSSPVTVTVRAR